MDSAIIELVDLVLSNKKLTEFVHQKDEQPGLLEVMDVTDFQGLIDSEKSDGNNESALEGKLSGGTNLAEIAKVTQRFNKMGTNPTVKFLLSHQQLYLLALDYAMTVEEVTSERGIFSRVNSYINRKIIPDLKRLLASKVIYEEKLSFNEEEKAAIGEEVANLPFNFQLGSPLPRVAAIIDKYKGGDKIAQLVEDYFRVMQIPVTTDTPRIKASMVDYLTELGINIDFEVGDTDTTDIRNEIWKELGLKVPDGTNPSEALENKIKEIVNKSLADFPSGSHKAEIISLIKEEFGFDKNKSAKQNLAESIAESNSNLALLKRITEILGAVVESDEFKKLMHDKFDNKKALTSKLKRLLTWYQKKTAGTS